MRKIISIVGILTIGLLAGCASVPMASLQQDTEAKAFTTVPGKANIYVYRNESFGSAVKMPLTLDGKIAGQSGPKTYFKWSVDPGQHEIASITENTSRLTLNTDAGKNYFVWQEVKMGMWTAQSQLHEVTEEEGRKGVLECKLADSEFK
jgi:hypothetical protein